VLPNELVARGQHVMTVCNACRYCEGYCPVFQAMETRRAFRSGDLAYLANLCHNCGECLYACQYAPPHEFGINVPRTLAEIRLATYEDACWPPAARQVFRRQRSAALTLLVVGLMAMAFGAHRLTGASAGDFYGVVPHETMVTVFGIAGLFSAAALIQARGRFVRRLMADAQEVPRTGASPHGPRPRAWGVAATDALTLRHLHGAGEDCTSAEESRGPWRRRLHHLTFYGFALCFASTTVAAFYHVVLGWRAPYPYTSVPVILGTLGGVGLVAGPIGLLAQRAQRDPLLGDPVQRPLDTSLLSMLLLTSGTGLLLLALRDSALMPGLLVVHLGAVLALFLMLPYGKFVHGLHRLSALHRYAAERQEGG
jgi:citrate/tricarballylate utilization protein